MGKVFNYCYHRRRHALKAIIALSVIAVAFAGAWYLLMSGDFDAFQSWILRRGAWGPLIFTAIYVVMTIAGVPGAPLTIVAGALFGSVTGIMSIYIGSIITCASCFLIARYFARDAVEAWLLKKERFRRLDRLIEDKGSIIVAIIRIIPLMPFAFVNYGFGLTRVRFWTYLIFSMIFISPGVVMHVVGTDAAIQFMKSGRVPWQLIGIVAGVFALLILLIPFAKKIIKSAPAPAKD